MAARKPKVVVPGPMALSASLDASAIDYTRGYLLAFEEELAKASDSAALVAAMKRRYPDAGMGVALDVGAKVAKGELKWGMTPRTRVFSGGWYSPSGRRPCPRTVAPDAVLAQLRDPNEVDRCERSERE